MTPNGLGALRLLEDTIATNHFRVSDVDSVDLTVTATSTAVNEWAGAFSRAAEIFEASGTTRVNFSASPEAAPASPSTTALEVFPWSEPSATARIPKGLLTQVPIQMVTFTPEIAAVLGLTEEERNAVSE